MAKPIYLGVFLDDASVKLLERTFPYAHSKHYNHHLTIAFKPDPKDPRMSLIGEKVSLKVIGYAADDKAQAVLIDPKGLRVDNAHPHVTISTAEGVPPVYSNELLQNGYERVAGPILTGEINTEPRTAPSVLRIVSNYIKGSE